MNKKIVGIFVSKNLVFMIAVVLLCAISLEGKAFSIKGLNTGMSMPQALSALDKKGYECTENPALGQFGQSCQKKGSLISDMVTDTNGGYYMLLSSDGKQLTGFGISCGVMNCGAMNVKQLTQALVKAKIMRKPTYSAEDGGYSEMDSSGSKILVFQGDHVMVVVEVGTGGPSFD